MAKKKRKSRKKMSQTVTPSKLSYAVRREKVVRYIHLGYTVPDIAKQFGVHRRTIYRDLASVGKSIRKRQDEIINSAFSWIYNKWDDLRDRLNDQYKNACDADDHKEAARIVDKMRFLEMDFLDVLIKFKLLTPVAIEQKFEGRFSLMKLIKKQVDVRHETRKSVRA